LLEGAGAAESERPAAQGADRHGAAERGLKESAAT